MYEQAKIIKEADNFLNLEQNFQGHVRGEEPTDLQNKCLELCQQFSGGNWTKLTVKDIEVERQTGGLSNKIYGCKIVDSKATDGKEPQEVAIRLYGLKFDFTFQNSDDRLNDALITLLASEKGLGPHVYGLFKEGQIQKYYPVTNALNWIWIV